MPTENAKSLETNLPMFPGNCGIGSLPHHNVDTALAFSFKMEIPFLPQIPIRNPWEYMIAQALEGMPGLLVDSDGTTRLDLAVWTGRSHAFNEKLAVAFGNPEGADAFETFEPSTAASSSWQPFLWELQERKIRCAKIQLAGPLTSQWALTLKDGGPADRFPEIGDQIYRLLLARAIGMSRRLQAGKTQAILFLDEPGLYGLDANNPRHLMGLQQIKLMVQALRKEGVIVGLHCCSNTDWTQVLGLGIQLISIDCQLSLENLLQHKDAVSTFLDARGRFSLGVIPTTQTINPKELNGQTIFLQVWDTFAKAWLGDEQRIIKTMREAIYTPACGLALHSPKDCETIVTALQEFRFFCQQTLQKTTRAN